MTCHRPMGLPTNGRKPGTMPRQQDRQVTWGRPLADQSFVVHKSPLPFRAPASAADFSPVSATSVPDSDPRRFYPLVFTKFFRPWRDQSFFFIF
ncbi:MAG: hypothetical protein C6W56_16140 [Caldibacillus debilis]|nr:MAG: hypothetical protein BAA03_08185 [Caldibacillus debilis]REJ22561.1 MAG: hypothetical protein C6W56_16140 [Caldibacillus debilis]